MALGFFDGCHLGHQEILQTCREIGGQSASVFTFPNHPTTVIPGRDAPRLITTSAERIQLLEEFGLQVFLKTFDRDFSCWSSERFVTEILVEKLHAKHVVVGHDFRFGHRAAGNASRLKEYGKVYGFECTVIAAVKYQAKEPFVISSTRIRQAVAEGDLELAARLMSRPFFVTSKVQEGAKRGRVLGFPTANLEYPKDKVELPYGVMVVEVSLEDGRRLAGVANFGLRPTVDGDAKRPLLEVHLFDFDGDLYGETLRVEFLSFLRPERRFDSLDALKAQIADDADQAKAFFKEL